MTYTTEQLLERWEAVHEIENLMGRRAFLLMLVRDQRVFEELWSKNAPCLGVNAGYYQGQDAIAGYLAYLSDLQLARAEAAIAAHPEALDGKLPEDALGAGALHPNNLTTPVIELAGDMQTAKGLWYVMDTHVDFSQFGHDSMMSWGRVGVDFIREGGQWKIWHMIFAEDFYTTAGYDWTAPTPERTVLPEFAHLAHFKAPRPNVPQRVYELWHDRRQAKAFPAVPEPYETFADTFSYGV